MSGSVPCQRYSPSRRQTSLGYEALESINVPVVIWPTLLQRCKSDSERVRGLLTRWREKVYELLVRRKLQEIEDIEHKQGVHKKVSPENLKQSFKLQI